MQGLPIETNNEAFYEPDGFYFQDKIHLPYSRNKI